MKELLKLGVYTLLGTLLLSAPFAGLGQRKPFGFN